VNHVATAKKKSPAKRAAPRRQPAKSSYDYATAIVEYGGLLDQIAQSYAMHGERSDKEMHKVFTILRDAYHKMEVYTYG
jgi:hypothetical protein